MKQLFCAVWLAIALPGCQTSTNETPSEAQQIYEQTMELHDDVMPRMDEIMQLRQKLQLRVEAMREEDSIKYADSLQKMQQVVQSLQEADRAMMEWMRSVKKPSGMDGTASAEEVDTTSLLRTLRQQKAAMVQVKAQMENSIQEAQRMIGLPE